MIKTMHERVERLPWDDLRHQLDKRGFAVSAPVLNGRSAPSSPASSTAGASAPRSTWRAIASATAATATSTTRCPDTIAELRERVLRAARADRERLERLLGGAGTPSRRARRAAAALPRRRAGAADAADPALRRGRLERPAPGPLRRRLLPVPGPDRAVGAGRGLRGRRARAARAAPAGAEPRARGPAAARRVRDLPDAAPPEPRQAGRPQGRPAPRRQHHHARPADRTRHHLPRRR